MSSEFLMITPLTVFSPIEKLILNGQNCFKDIIKDQIQENCASRTFMNTLRVNSLLITYAGVQR